MTLSEVAVRRPVFAIVLNLLVVLVGVISYQRLSVREYPNIDAPVVSVRTVYPGASPEIMETQVSKVLEDAIAGIEGIKVLKSTSREEVSEVTVQFLLERDADAAANDVRDRVGRVRSKLPDDVREPVISKVEADAQAIIWLAFSSDRHGPLEITDYADRQVVDRLQSLPGVASVIIGGERRYAMRLWLDADRLAAYDLTPADVEQALRRQNLEVPAGRIESVEREFSILAETDLRTPEQFEALVLRYVNGYPVRLRDVGRAELGAETERRAVRFMGQPAVGLGVVKQSVANTLEVARAVKTEVPLIRESLPQGMEMRVAFDTSVFIEESIASVWETIAEALLLVVLVIFVFLRSLRATLIPSLAIPVSLVGAFAFMYAMGFSVNILTLLALVLAIGIVVDDAIVVLENIHRHVEDGMTPFAAALQGSREITFAVVVMTVSMASVFVPLAFMTGNTGRLFREFALAVSGAVLVSGLVALTLTPTLSARLLRHERSHSRLYQVFGRGFDALAAGYSRALRASLRVRWLVVVLGVAVGGGSYGLFNALKAELSPLEDRGFLLAFLLAPEGSSFEFTDRYTRWAETFFSDIPEIRQYFMVVAPGLENPTPVTTAISFVSLHPWSERERKQQDIAGQLAPRFFSLPGVMAFPVNPPSLGQSFRDPPVQFVIQADSYEALQETVDQLVAKASAYPGLANVDTDLRLNKPQVAVTLDRDRVADVGADVDAIGRTLETLFAGREVTRFKRGGEQYEVILQIEDRDRTTPSDLGRVYVRGADGTLVQLDNLVSLSERVAPKELNHFDRARAAKISANVGQGYALGEALAFLEGAAAEVLKPGMRIALDGQSLEFRESATSMYITFGLALVFIYLVLAAQFESFVDPLTILLSVPLAAFGALGALLLTGGTVNVFSQIGMVMLVGLTAKNAILIVDFANRQREIGASAADAVVEAARLRLRPILMTSLTMVLAALPLALATGAGAESRQQIGWVILGGMLVGTLLSLFLVPTVYTLLSRHAQVAGSGAAHAGPEAG